MNLHNLSNVTGAKKRKKRVGCGEGSGRGKTSTRGQKGQKSRTGSGIRPGFEGGQMPLYRKLPHRGFNNYNFRVDYELVNVADLEKVSASEIGREELIAAGLIRKNTKLIKILGDGEISKAVTITADKFSGSAKSKIEAAGGTINVSAPKQEEKAAES